MKDGNYKQKDIVHVSFEIGLILKGIHGLMEIIGGVFLLFLSPNRLNWLTRFLTQHEISEDPKDKVANLLLTLSSSFSISAQHFAVFYLMSHGIIKCILILLLWRRKLWAYPLTIVTLILFIAYQVYRYTFTQSVFLILLTIFDTVMIALTYLEYKRIK
jgi:Predicted membrane protein